ncbi:ABC-type transport system, substrat-binding component [Alteracholeplasma palmae J233]|uniref:ABC-type transport system, substrat-binding component n=1 Tax=Alteracholeplasma palmae (strain ATCC 49389 / J233) TaxID=1318466 RepID=U4KNM1_ALTPJ|nr:ABC transporter substrate-binding protein [Alteracholeplasma palmae]CCV63795.1 ABC-type transport system, substrat-binding component [Alteracholeplasma palmae J233]
MKKLFGILLTAVATLTLVACGDSFKKDPNTYYTSISDTTNINPYSVTLANASTLYDLVSAGLYRGEIDWAASGKTEGDFSDTANLVYTRVPFLAAEQPQAFGDTVKTNEDTTNPDAATESQEWKIKLRSGLTFEDGTPITATTYVESWKRLLDPKVLNDRAVNIYDTSYVGIVGAESYFSQGKSVVDSASNPVFTDEVNKNNADIENPDQLGYVYLAESKNKDGLVVRTAGWYPESVEAEDAVTADRLPDGTEDVELAKGGKVKVPAGKVRRYYKEFSWDNVEVQAVDNDTTIQFALRKPKSRWDLKGSFTSAVTGVVHLAKYDAGMSADGTKTTYGTAENPLISYGPYKLTTWQKSVVFEFSKNDKFFDKDAYRIEKIRYNVLTDQKVIVNEFEAGRIDVAGVGGSYFDKYKSHPTLKLTPDSYTFRFAFNSERKVDGKLTAVSINEFRKAFYFAVNRTELANGSAAPATPTQTLLNDQYYTSEFATTKYRDTASGKAVIQSLSPATQGYNPTEAKRLFDEAYNKAVTEGLVVQGQPLKLEYLVLNADSNIAIANQVKESVLNAFQAKEGQANAGKFEFVVNAQETDAMDDLAKKGSFDIMFRAWGGLDFDAVGLLGQVYSNKYSYMNEKGFQTADKVLTFTLSDKAIEKINKAKNTDTEKKYTNILVNGNDVTAKYDDAFNLLEYEILYSEYSERAGDLAAIAAAMEKYILVDEVIAIPLFGRVGASAYSSRVKFDFQAYHSWLGWGGLRYMSLTTDK